MSFENKVTDYLEFVQKKLQDKSMDDAKALHADLEKYKSKDDCTDAEFKELQAQNRYLINQVERQKKEIERLKANEQ